MSGHLTAEAIARALGGRKAGACWMACCPAHADRTPSLSIQDSANGTVLVHCFSGCDQRQVLKALKACGLWPGREGHAWRPARSWHETARPDADAAHRIEAAKRLWRAALPASGTLVQRYLEVRGLNLPMPKSLRYAPSLGHPSGVQLPAMLAAIQAPCGKITGVHRTWLRHDGSGKAAVTPNKAMLGRCVGCAVRFAQVGVELAVGEGIETCLAVVQATGLQVWAALSTSGIRALQLPEQIHSVVILADGDRPGEAAAQAAADRFIRQGRQVRIARPPRGSDFNDLLFGAHFARDEETGHAVR